MRWASAGLWLLLALPLVAVGCTRNEDYLAVFREQRAAWKELADILETVKDEQTMAQAKDKLEDRARKYDVLVRRAKALPAPPPEEVRVKLEDDRLTMEAFIQRLRKETDRVRKLPGGEDFLASFESVSPGLFSAVQR